MLNREFRPAQASDPASRHVLDRLTTTRISGLTITGAGQEVICELQDGAWMLRRPIEADADEAVISGIIASLEAMRRDEVITAVDRSRRDLSLHDYGLEPPRTALRLSDGTSVQEILIGTNAPLGSAIYVKLTDSDEVLATSSLIIDALPAQVGALRDRALLHGDLSSTCRLEIRHPDGTMIRLVRDHNRWSIRQPINSSANDDRIKQMLNTLYSARIGTFVWDPPAGTMNAKDQTNTPPFRLTADNARLKISVWVGDDDVGRTLLVGNDSDIPDSLYVRRSECESIYTVSNHLLNVFSVRIDELRDRDVFPMDPSLVRRLEIRQNDRKLVLRRTENGWSITEPLRCKADDTTVDEAIRKLALTQIHSYVSPAEAAITQSNFASPSFSITMDTCTTDAISDRNNATTISIGPTVSNEPGYVYAMIDASNDLVVAETNLSAALGPRPADPLSYRDRTVLTLAPDSISRIRLTRESDTFEIRRNSLNAWSSSTPSGGIINSDSLDDILQALACLRAIRLEGYAESNIAAYGLDNPSATILVEVSGESTTSYRSILLGFLAGTDGVYAMVQGQDVVFVLDRVTAERLTRDLIVPLPRPVPTS
jgi:hypothetical protein